MNYIYEAVCVTEHGMAYLTHMVVLFLVTEYILVYLFGRKSQVIVTAL